LFTVHFCRRETHIGSMSFNTRCPALSTSLMMAELAWASWETIIRRTVMMAQSTCSPAEYRRMLDEKTAAALEIGGLLFAPDGASAEALLAPWHSRATANAKRLRG